MATRYVNVYRSSGTGITPPNVGDFWSSQGGYYIGNKTYGGDNYALILAPKNLFPIILMYDNITSGMANVPKATYIIYDDIRNVSKDADDGESITNNMLNIFISNNLLLIVTFLPDASCCSSFRPWSYRSSYLSNRMAARKCHT